MTRKILCLLFGAIISNVGIAAPCSQYVAQLANTPPAQLEQKVQEIPQTCRATALQQAGAKLYENKRYAEAIPFYQQSLNADPCDEEIYLWLGGVYEWKKDYELAACHFQKGRVLAQDPARKQEYQGAYSEVMKKITGVPSRQLACSVELGKQIAAAHCGDRVSRALDGGMSRDLVAELEGGSAEIKINFDYNKDTPTTEGQNAIRQLVATLKSELGSVSRDLGYEAEDAPIPAAPATASPGRKTIRLIGHSDERGKADYNLNMSRRRAETVKMALAKVFPKVKYIVEGKGSSAPLVKNAQADADHAVNRRVEIRIN